MEELIFFAVLIFFSIVESIARSRKKQKGGPLPEIPGETPPGWKVERPGQMPTRRPSPDARPRMSDVQSYDDDPSFDTRTTSEREPSFDEIGTSEEERRRRSASSESMIPGDIWEEIAGLAREARVELPKPQPRLPKTQLPQPPQPRRAPQPKAPAPKPPLRPRPTAPQPRKPTLPEPILGGRAAHPVHLSHVGYGTDPSERARSAQDVVPPIAPAVNADAAAVRQQLLGEGTHGLRQAIILLEILGPPASSKPDRFGE